MQLTINDITPEVFLRDYWQKKPLVIRQGFTDFKDLLAPDEMAGLACEEEVESRRVFKTDGQWQAEFGPFESYDHLGNEGWTLIVQALNNWVPKANELIKCFDFIPRWRLDDLMVSFATPGGGVGPHIDLYDVFICQGSGSRRWRVGDLGPHTEFSAHPALLHTEEFTPIIDTELNTGDILYIPPGYPHDGISINNSMSFSVGFRTDSAKDMMSGLADFMLDKNLANNQITDPDRNCVSNAGMIDVSDFSRIKQHLISTLNDEMIANFAGEFLTRSKCALDLPDQCLDFTSTDIIELIKNNPLIRLGGLRCLYVENTVNQGVFYINGDKINLPEALSEVIPLLCNNYQINSEQLAKWLENSLFLQLITQWVNAGYWYFDEIDE